MKGSIVQRAPGSWTLRFDAGYDASGKRKQKVVTVKGTKRDAERELARLMTEQQNGTYVDPTKLTVAEFLQQWLNAYAKTNVSRKTYDGYAGIIHPHLIPSLGHLNLAKLQPLHLLQYYTAKLEHGRRDGKGGLSARTVLHHHRVLREALRHAVEWQLIGRNPADAADPPDPEDKEARYLTDEQARQLLVATHGTALYLPILLAITTGMRRGEILGLRWQDVDLKAGTLSVRQSLSQTSAGLIFKPPKTKKGRRVITLPEFVVVELSRFKGCQPEQRRLFGDAFQEHGLVVTEPDGAPIRPNAFSQRFIVLVDRLGLDITFHGLRHTHATHLFARNVHPKIVSERLGHGDIGITLNIYSHMLPGMQEEAARHVHETFKGIADLPALSAA